MEQPTKRWADWLEAANYAFKRGAFTEAVEFYSGALSDASSTSASASERAKVFANRAFAYQKAGAANQADARTAPLSSLLCGPCAGGAAAPDAADAVGTQRAAWRGARVMGAIRRTCRRNTGKRICVRWWRGVV